jgi:hypothetical protein
MPPPLDMVEHPRYWQFDAKPSDAEWASWKLPAVVVVVADAVEVVVVVELVVVVVLRVVLLSCKRLLLLSVVFV